VRQLLSKAYDGKLLTITSGGIRSIIQLEILRLIEMEWNGKLPIQCFFDMIAGKG